LEFTTVVTIHDGPSSRKVISATIDLIELIEMFV